MVSIGLLSFILSFNVFDSSKDLVGEIFDETMILLFIYILLTFTDLVIEAETRSDIGLVFIGIFVLSLLFHSSCIALNLFKKLKKSVQRIL